MLNNAAIRKLLTSARISRPCAPPLTYKNSKKAKSQQPTGKAKQENSPASSNTTKSTTTVPLACLAALAPHHKSPKPLCLLHYNQGDGLLHKLEFETAAPPAPQLPRRSVPIGALHVCVPARCSAAGGIYATVKDLAVSSARWNWPPARGEKNWRRP